MVNIAKGVDDVGWISWVGLLLGLLCIGYAFVVGNEIIALPKFPNYVFLLWIAVGIACFLIDRIMQNKKPIINTKATVQSKYGGRGGYSIVFLLPNKKSLELYMKSDKFYSVEKGDIVDLQYQGWLVRSIEKIQNDKKIPTGKK